jgi:dTDP-4-dehydrorhamnose 3,5-epimerase
MESEMQFEPTSVPDVVLIRPRVFGDARGFFFESWEKRKFAAAGLGVKFMQDNHSHSVRHTLRGLHYQIQQAQGKLVRVAAGAVFDVAVDLRRGSPTFGRSVGVTLSADNHAMLWIPPGFAHGFLVLSESADFLYRVTDFWAPTHERAILWNDPDLAINWPLPPGVGPLLSAKDAAAVRFREAEYFP